MREISAYKRFIEQELPPEDTSVIWVKLANDSENINKMKVEDLLQFVNGEWTSIVSKNTEEILQKTPYIEDVDSNIVLVKACANYKLSSNSLDILEYDAPYESAKEYEPSLIAFKAQELAGKILQKAGDIDYEPSPYMVPSYWVYHSQYGWVAPDTVDCVTMYSTAWPSLTADSIVIFLYPRFTRRGLSDTGYSASDLEFEWPDGFDEIKATWDDINS